MWIICDGRAAPVDFSAEQVRDIVTHFRSLRRQFVRDWVIVVPNKVMFGLARMMATLLASDDIVWHIYTELDVARAKLAELRHP
jgi:hypothetical protein